MKRLQSRAEKAVTFGTVRKSENCFSGPRRRHCVCWAPLPTPNTKYWLRQISWPGLFIVANCPEPLDFPKQIPGILASWNSIVPNGAMGLHSHQPQPQYPCRALFAPHSAERNALLVRLTPWCFTRPAVAMGPNSIPNSQSLLGQHICNLVSAEDRPCAKLLTTDVEVECDGIEATMVSRAHLVQKCLKSYLRLLPVSDHNHHFRRFVQLMRSRWLTPINVPL